MRARSELRGWSPGSDSLVAVHNATLVIKALLTTGPLTSGLETKTKTNNILSFEPWNKIKIETLSVGLETKTMTLHKLQSITVIFC